MKRTLARGALFLSAAALATSGLVIAPAGAAAPKSHGACRSITTKTVGSSIVATLKNCTPVAATGGSGSGTFKAGQTSGKLSASLKWSKGKGTTKGTVTLAPQATGGKCPVGSTRIKITGKVTGGTGVAGKTFKKGEPVTGSVCTNAATGKTSLAPGTSLKF